MCLELQFLQINLIMLNYTQWQNNQLYMDHINRLTKIKNKPTKIYSSLDKIHHQQYQKKTKYLKSQNQVTLPLVSQTQRKLLGQTVNHGRLSLKQKQLLLENYLLGRRILATQPVVKSIQLKKQFLFHKKVSKSMSKASKAEQSYNHQRTKMYSSLMKDQRKTKGFGRYQLCLKIIDFYLIKTKIDTNNPDILFQLIRRSKHKAIKLISRSFKQILQTQIKVNLKSYELKETLRIEMRMVKKNQMIKIGQFKIQLSDKRHYNRQKRVQNINKINQASIIGTIQFEFELYQKSAFHETMEFANNSIVTDQQIELEE